MSARDELKPCPFCGAQASVKPGYPLCLVICDHCRSRAMSATEAQAIANWNRRTPEPLGEAIPSQSPPTDDQATKES